MQPLKSLLVADVGSRALAASTSPQHRGSCASCSLTIDESQRGQHPSRMNVATAYDAANAGIFLSSGGSGRVRQALVDTLDLRPGHRVLELGCGTGQVTARLVAAGAEVVAVDALPAMLGAARRRAPGARFIEGDAMETQVGGDFDRVVLSFVLHNFDREGRVGLLRRAAAALSSSGRIGVLEWALPHGRVRAALWRRFLRALEPSPTVPELLAGALDIDIPAAGLQIRERRRVAGGRAQILVVSHPTERSGGSPSHHP